MLFRSLTKAEAKKVAQGLKKDNVEITPEMWDALGIKPFATGGNVTQPTIGLIGEAGAEAVIPLSKMNRMSNGSGDIIVQVSGTDPNAVVDALRRYVRQNGTLGWLAKA